MKLPKFLWNATYQAMVQERDSWKELAEYWQEREEAADTFGILWFERSKALEAQLAAIRKQRSETTRRGNATKSAKRFAATAPKAAEMRGRV